MMVLPVILTSLGIKETQLPHNEIISSSASSVFDNPYDPNLTQDNYGPQFLHSGWLSTCVYDFYHSGAGDTNPWVEMVLASYWTITRYIQTQKN